MWNEDSQIKNVFKKVSDYIDTEKRQTSCQLEANSEEFCREKEL